MEEQAQSTPIQTPPPQPVVMVHKSNKTPLVGAIIFLALVIAAAAWYLGSQGNNADNVAPTNQPSTTTPTPTIPIPTTTTSTDLKIQTITKLKDSAFTSFTVSHPEDWVADTKVEADMMQTLTLSKDGNKIEIYQAPMGGNQCIFEGELPEGPSNDYRNNEYKEIIAGDITLRRLIDNPNQNQNMYSFCSNSTNSKTSFGVPTVFGNITYTLVNNNNIALSEMDKIISSLKAL